MLHRPSSDSRSLPISSLSTRYNDRPSHFLPSRSAFRASLFSWRTAFVLSFSSWEATFAGENRLASASLLPRAEVPMVAARRFFAAGKYYNTSKSKFWTLLEVKAFLNVVCFVCFMLSATNEKCNTKSLSLFLKSRYFWYSSEMILAVQRYRAIRIWISECAVCTFSMVCGPGYLFSLPSRAAGAMRRINSISFKTYTLKPSLYMHPRAPNYLRRLSQHVLLW